MGRFWRALLLFVVCVCLPTVGFSRAHQDPPKPTFTITGSNFHIETIKEGGTAFGNRSYTWTQVPSAISGWQYTRVKGGDAASITVHTSEACDVYIACLNAPKDDAWEALDGNTITYSDKKKTTLQIYHQSVGANVTLEIPQDGWAGTLVLAPVLTSKEEEPPKQEEPPQQDGPVPPGIVIDVLEVEKHWYVGSPSIVVLPDGSYVASHDMFGSGDKGDVTILFRSTDRGVDWTPIARLNGQFWSSLFINRGALYIIGTDRAFGHIVIRGSTDDGFHWSVPTNLATGILSQEAGYHCAPTPVVEFNGRLWRAFEKNPVGAKGRQFQAILLSASVDANLLQSGSWSITNPVGYNVADTGGNWLEGNAVVTPNQVVDVMRLDKQGQEKAAMLRASPDGRQLTWGPGQDLINFPGGAVKFTIRYDPVSRMYWSLVNKQRDPEARRNVLALVSSPDLYHWKVEATVLRHADKEKHAFQYVDWQFDGDDIIAVARTSWNGDSFHNANFFTFHRVRNFRLATRSLE